MANAAGQPHNAGMKAWLALSLAFLWTAVGARASEPTVTVHKCTDARGVVTWQNSPCPKGSRDESREMIRPVDAPPSKARHPPAVAPAPPAPDDYLPPRRELIPPPPMYLCTTYDGNERYSEQYDPNPRCEPYVIYYPYPSLLTPAQALSCRWVEDSCVRLSDRSACERWKTKKKEAASAVLSSFSDTAAYRKSELARITQIVDESCL